MDSLLQIENRLKADELIPMDIIVAIFTVSGIIGNILVMFFYTQKTPVTPTTVLIVALAAADAIVCVTMPKSIVICEYIYQFTSAVFCKLYVFNNFLTSQFSALTLLAIGMFRYRLVCRPLSVQYSVRDSYIAVGILFVSSLLLTIPAPILYEISTTNVTVRQNVSLTIYQCDTTKKPHLQTCVLFMHVMHSVVYFGCVFYLIVSYGLIGRVMFKFRNRKRSRSIHIPPLATPSIKTDTNLEARELEVCNNKDNAISAETQGLSDGRILGFTNERSAVTQERKAPTSDESVFKLTMMVFVAYFVFVFSFIPYFTISYYSVIHSDFDQVPTLFTKLCFNSYLLNSVTNPFIYVLYHLKFRKFVKRTCCRLNILK